MWLLRELFLVRISSSRDMMWESGSYQTIACTLLRKIDLQEKIVTIKAKLLCFDLTNCWSRNCCLPRRHSSSCPKHALLWAPQYVFEFCRSCQRFFLDDMIMDCHRTVIFGSVRIVAVVFGSVRIVAASVRYKSCSFPTGWSYRTT